MTSAMDIDMANLLSAAIENARSTSRNLHRQ